MVLRILLYLVSAVAVALSSGVTIAGSAEKVVRMGVIRWDNWNVDSSHGELADISSRDRIPYFARREAGGRLMFIGDIDNVLQADIEYAKAAAVNYFIFGYYIDTGAWKRDKMRAQSLNRAFQSYLNIANRRGINFALSFNWSFPAEDVAEVASVISSVANHPNYERASTGLIPVFFFTPDLDRWAKGFGGVTAAGKALADIRERVLRSTGKKMYAVALLFGIRRFGSTAVDIGFDALSTYANGLEAEGKSVAYSVCAAGARSFWESSRGFPVGFLPTVTLGWDYRPVLGNAEEAATRKPNPSWCEPATAAEWQGQILEALKEARTNPRNEAFASIVLYAWNEFSEGGWMAPTVGEGARRVGVIGDALGHKADRERIKLVFPARVDTAACDVRSHPRTFGEAGPECRPLEDKLTTDWPCPWPKAVVTDVLRAPSGSEASIHRGPWQERTCQ
jgi:hypothetical protein